MLHKWLKFGSFVRRSSVLFSHRFPPAVFEAAQSPFSKRLRKITVFPRFVRRVHIVISMACENR